MLAFSYRLPGTRAKVAVLPLAFPLSPKMVAGAPAIISIYQSRRMTNGSGKRATFQLSQPLKELLWVPHLLTSAYITLATHFAKEASKCGPSAKLVSGFDDSGFLFEMRKEAG